MDLKLPSLGCNYRIDYNYCFRICVTFYNVIIQSCFLITFFLLKRGTVVAITSTSKQGTLFTTVINWLLPIKLQLYNTSYYNNRRKVNVRKEAKEQSGFGVRPASDKDNKHELWFIKQYKRSNKNTTCILPRLYIQLQTLYEGNQ